MSEQSQNQSIYYVQDKLAISTTLQEHVQPLADKHEDGNNHCFKLACALQSAHNINDIIKIYSTNIQPLIPHDSMTFKNELMRIDLALGVSSQHRCSYNLTFSNQPLGKISLTRKDKFSETELSIFENLLSVLFYPLGNALYN